MSCFPCFSSKRTNSKREQPHGAHSKEFSALPPPEKNKQKASAVTKNKEDKVNTVENGNIAAQTFAFRELASATKNFRQECLLGEGGFGRVYKGKLEQSGQIVAVKQLDRNGLQGNKEFLVEVLMLSLLHHQNLVNLVGYCADGEQRLLVYEYMPLGSLEDHLLDIAPDQKPLDWFTRMKIASGAAKGLEYLHDKANPPVIYRDLKSSNILLDENFNPKLSDFGLAKLGPIGDKIHVSSRVMGTYGYCAPEYARSGELTLKSDVYSFGVVLLELITGRRAIDTTRQIEEQNLVAWAQPLFRDQSKFPEMADRLLNGEFPVRGLNQAVAIAAMCLQEEAAVRPLINDVVTALSFLSVVPDEVVPTPVPVSTPPSEEKIANEHEDHPNHQDGANADNQDKGIVDCPIVDHADHTVGDIAIHNDGDSANHQDQDNANHQNGDSAEHQDGDSAVHQEEDSADHQDGDNADHQDTDSSDDQDGDSSDYQDEDSVVHSDEDSADDQDTDSADDQDRDSADDQERCSANRQDKDSADEPQQPAVTKAIELGSSSRHNRIGSQDGSVSSP